MNAHRRGRGHQPGKKAGRRNRQPIHTRAGGRRAMAELARIRDAERRLDR